MDDHALTRIFEHLFFRTFPEESRMKISAHFKSRKSLNHSIEKNGRHLHLKISSAFKDVPEDIIELLGLILFSKLLKSKLDINIKTRYNEYVDKYIAPNLKRITHKPSSNYTPIGKYFNLTHIFEELNNQIFNNKIPEPQIGWSLNDSYTRLGFYSAEKNLLVISRIFDNRKAPRNIVYFLMYHEMLHIKHPVQNNNGRRIIHSREFKAEEKLFPDYHSIQKWLRRKRYKL